MSVIIYVVVWALLSFIGSFLVGIFNRNSDYVDIGFITLVMLLWPVTVPIAIVASVGFGISYLAHRLGQHLQNRRLSFVAKPNPERRQPTKKVHSS